LTKTATRWNWTKPGSGRPALPEADRKTRVTLYLDPDVLARLKADGKGWQTRANAALRRALGI
jgi:uncharacterized protein (DUF4415 family)